MRSAKEDRWCGRDQEVALVPDWIQKRSRKGAQRPRWASAPALRSGLPGGAALITNQA